MEKIHKAKVAQEKRASGISPGECEVDREMKDIIQLLEQRDRYHEKLSKEKCHTVCLKGQRKHSRFHKTLFKATFYNI